MKNYREVSDADLAPLSNIKGLARLENNKCVVMVCRFEIAFQTAVAASRFRASFYDLSLKMRGARDKGDEEARRIALSTFALGLDEIRREQGLGRHDDMARDLPPFDNRLSVYRVNAVDRGCLALFGGYFQLDTFVMAVTSTRDTSLISGAQATALISRADALFDKLKDGYLCTRPALGMNARTSQKLSQLTSGDSKR